VRIYQFLEGNHMLAADGAINNEWRYAGFSVFKRPPKLGCDQPVGRGGGNNP
jgi:hypothetical protein